ACCQRAGAVRPRACAEQRFVGRQMQVDEARDNQVSRRINRLSRRRGEVGSDGRNPSLFDPNIDELVPATQPSIADEKIHGALVCLDASKSALTSCDRCYM